MLHLTFEELRRANLLREREYPSKAKFTPEFYAISLAGEVGELCNSIKKQLRDGVDYKKQITKEIADIQTYLDLLAASMNVDLAQATVEKFNEVSDRIDSSVRL